MKIHLLSDLHLEFQPYEIEPDLGADVIVLAGDIHTGTKAQEFIKTLPEVPVLYIAGNHEYYGNKFPELMLRLAVLEGCKFLERQAVIIDDVKFMCCTLWTDFKFNGNAVLSKLEALKWLNDYSTITNSERDTRLLPEDTEAVHKTSVEWLDKELSEDHAGPKVVVTHHAPHPKSMHPAYKGDPLNACFISDLNDMIEYHQPDLWLHGHTHNAAEYQVGSTRVFCNPRGYKFGENTGFNSRFIVEV